jgi:hypothetical protein
MERTEAGNQKLCSLCFLLFDPASARASLKISSRQEGGTGLSTWPFSRFSNWSLPFI